MIFEFDALQAYEFSSTYLSKHINFGCLIIKCLINMKHILSYNYYSGDMMNAYAVVSHFREDIYCARNISLKNSIDNKTGIK